MTIRLRPRPTAVRQVCADCEATRDLLRRQGRRTWDPLLALCHACYRRARARVAPPVQVPVPEPARPIAC
ncbi:MAG: hypothetical protein AB7H88_20645 [Vicinamibacterales bacterium]